MIGWRRREVGLGIMPLFAFANAGVNLTGLSLEALIAPVSLGIMLGLFIGTLAFEGPDQATAVRLGVLSGSILSATAGYLVLRYAISVKPSQTSRSPDQFRLAGQRMT